MKREMSATERFETIMGYRRGHGDIQALLSGAETPAARTSCARILDELRSGKGNVDVPAVLSAPASSSLLVALQDKVYLILVNQVMHTPTVSRATCAALDDLKVRTTYAKEVFVSGRELHLTEGGAQDVPGAIQAACGALKRAGHWHWVKRRDWQLAQRGGTGDGFSERSQTICPLCAQEVGLFEETNEGTSDYPHLTRTQKRWVQCEARCILEERLRRLKIQRIVDITQQALYAYRRALSHLVANEIIALGAQWFTDGILNVDELRTLEKGARCHGLSGIQDIFDERDWRRFTYYEITSAIPYSGMDTVFRWGLVPQAEALRGAMNRKLKLGSIHPAHTVHPASIRRFQEWPEGVIHEHHFQRLSQVDITYLVEREHDGRWLQASTVEEALLFLRSHRSDEGTFGLD